MKDFFVPGWHISLVLLPHGARYVRLFEHLESGTWECVGSWFYGWDDVLAQRHYDLLCRMMRGKEEGGNEQIA